MGERLKDKVAIVTGSGMGIGKAEAIALAQEGAKVVTNNSKPGNPGGDAETTAKEIRDMGGQAVPFFGSVADYEVAEKMIQAAVDKFGGLDILVNNAGVIQSHMVWNMTPEEWNTVIKIHLYGTFYMSKYAAALMRQQRSGRIINTTSIARLGRIVAIGGSNYAAAKGAIVSFTATIARELGKYGITCNAISPRGHSGREGGDLGPEHCAPLVVYLCTDEARDINGQIFNCRQGSIGIYSEPQLVNQIFNDGEIWSLEQLINLVPKTLLAGYKNPMPAQKPGQEQEKASKRELELD